MAQSNRKAADRKPEEKAAHGGDGQDQDPKQSRKESSSLWDTDQHSDAPGPFGTGSKAA